MLRFDQIVLIYNPQSTNGAKQKAEDFYAELLEHHFSADIIPTKEQGHAEKIAYEYTSRYHHPLIISVSGDGGYNEVINGALRAKQENKNMPVVAIIAAGNANDHKRTTRDQPLIDLIKSGKTKPLDILSIKAKSMSRFAHSYIGIGITPAVAKELNKHNLNPFNEPFVVLKSLYKFKPFQLCEERVAKKYNSIIFANTTGMAKVLKIRNHGGVHDGYFDILTIPASGKISLVFSLLTSFFKAPKPAKRTKKYTFFTTSDIDVQLDGEVATVAKGNKTTIELLPGALESLY